MTDAERYSNRCRRIRERREDRNWRNLERLSCWAIGFFSATTLIWAVAWFKGAC